MLTLKRGWYQGLPFPAGVKSLKLRGRPGLIRISAGALEKRSPVCYDIKY